jgi:hypothetical protein
MDEYAVLTTPALTSGLTGATRRRVTAVNMQA